MGCHRESWCGESPHPPRSSSAATQERASLVSTPASGRGAARLPPFELQQVRILLSGVQDEVGGAHGRHAGQVDLHVLVAIGNRFRIIARVRVDDGVVSNNDGIDRVGGDALRRRSIIDDVDRDALVVAVETCDGRKIELVGTVYKVRNRIERTFLWL